MVVADLDYELRLERAPRARALRRPAARATRCLAGEAGRCDQALEPFGQCFARSGLDARREADVLQQMVVVIEAEQQRADEFRVRAIAKAADHAIGAAEPFDLAHG